MGYSFRLTARVLFYASSHRQDNTYHGLCYTSRGTLAGTRNCSMGPLHEGSIRRPIAPRANALTTKLQLAPSTTEQKTASHSPATSMQAQRFVNSTKRRCTAVWLSQTETRGENNKPEWFDVINFNFSIK